MRLHRFDSIAAIQNNIRAVGYVLGLDERAEARVVDMDARLQHIQKGSRSRGAVWRVISWSGGYVAGAGTIFDSLLPYCGATNLATGVGSAPSLPFRPPPLKARLALSPPFAA